VASSGNALLFATFSSVTLFHGLKMLIVTASLLLKPPALRAPEPHRTTSHVHWRRTCSRLPATVKTFLRDSGGEYKCTYLLIYLLACLLHHLHSYLT